LFSEFPKTSQDIRKITYTIGSDYPVGLGAATWERSFEVPVDVTNGIDSNVIVQPTLANLRLLINNARVSNNTIHASEEFAISFDIFNDTSNITSARLAVYNDRDILESIILGTIPSGDGLARNEQLNILSGIEKIGNHTLTVALYSGETLITSRNINVTVTEPRTSPLLENVRFSASEVIQGQEFEVSADIFNGASDITNVRFAVFNGDTELTNTNRLISTIIREGDVLQNSSVPLQINTPGNYNLTLRLIYTDKNGMSHTVNSRSITVRVLPQAAGDSFRIQRISAPLQVELDSRANISVNLTNSTSSKVTGVNVYVYEGNNELDSVFISEIPANSSFPVPLDFHVTGRAGLRTFTVTISYKESDVLITDTFSLTAVSDDFSSSDERPSGLRIQRIDVPSQIFTSAERNIEFTLVNAGRGTAYNVEVFVIDELGNEIAREWVGNITAGMSTFNTSFPLRFNESGFYNLTFYASAENADETFSQISRSFEIQVSDYRINFTDMGGHEWVENNMINMEFAVVNGGDQIMSFVSAQLVDVHGNVWGERYIGTLTPGAKSDRVRFRDVYVNDGGTGFMQLGIRLTYENDKMQEFSVLHEWDAHFWSSNGGDWFPPPDDGWDWEEDDDNEASLWAVVIAVCAFLISGAVVLVIVLSKRKKVRGEDDDIDYFLSQLNVGAVSPNTAQPDSNKEEAHL
jgi:hypothetical protein